MSTEEQKRAAALSARLGALSPEKQALLARKLAERSAERGDVRADEILPRGHTGPAPLSHAQELLWLYEQMTPGTAAYNVPMARRVRGRLNVETLTQAFNALITRHESLRTTFVEVEGSPRQVVLEHARVAIEAHDLKALPDALRDTEAARVLQEGASRPFDLTVGTVPRVVLVSQRPDDALLLVVLHHIVFDGASAGVLLNELALFYDAIVEGQNAPVLPLRIQLADFATWERRDLADVQLLPALAFWRDELDGAPSGVELPLDFPRLPGAVGSGTRYKSVLSADTRDAVRVLAKSHDTTLFMALMAGFQLLLHRYSGQSDVVVGTAVAGRERPGTAALVGYLANTLALRARFTDNLTFAALLRQTRETVLRAFDHQDVPYEKLVRELRAGRPAAEQSLFSAMFTLQDSSVTVPKLGTATLEPFGIDLGAAKFDLTVSAAELSSGIEIVVEYRSDLFRADSVARLVEHFEVLLKAACRAPETAVARLPIVTDVERQRILVEWNDSDATWPTEATLHDLFSAQVRLRPHATAVECDGVRLTYAELDRRANQLAWQLRAYNVGPDVLVAVCMEKSAEVVAVLLGILKAGGAYVPIDPAYPDDRLAFMLEDSEARVIVTDVVNASRCAAFAVPVLVPGVNAGQDEMLRDDAPPAAAGPSNLCYVIYTSGSTGRPKGVLIEHRNVVRLLFNSRFPFAFSERDVWTVFHSFSFDFSVWEMYGALLYGGRVVVVPRHIAQQPAEYLALLESQGVTVLNQVPSAFYALMQEELTRTEANLALRYVIFGGEALQPALLREWQARYPSTTLVNMFGITETTVHVTHKVIGTREINDGASNIGVPIPTLTTYVLDAHQQLVPVGVTGELCVGGAGVARGYLKRSELTTQRFITHPFRVNERMYRSGDLGRFLPSGEIEYLGRGDAQVKLRGFRIELGEIEAVLAQHHELTSSVVMLRQDDAAGPRLVAYFVSRTAGLNRSELRAWAAARLPEFMVPSIFVELPVLPLTSNGKVDRKALPTPAAINTAGVITSPRDNVERVLAGIWRDVLGLSEVDVETSFFELGGHSLLAIRMVAQITKVFRVRLTLRSFFDASSVAGIARALVAEESAPGRTAKIAALFTKLQSLSPEERNALLRRQAGPDTVLETR